MFLPIFLNKSNLDVVAKLSCIYYILLFDFYSFKI